MNILITGATGYIGSRLVNHLARERHDISIIKRPESRLRHAPTEGGVAVYDYDGSTECMVEIVRQARPELVFHLAAMAIGEHKTEQLQDLINANVLFGTQMLEAMRVNGAINIVSASTAWQFCDGQAYNPWVLYAATKQAFEDIALFYANRYGMNITCLRLPDSYGPNDWRPKVLNLIKNSVREKRAIDLTLGQQEIDLLYIDDIVSGFLHAGKRLRGQDIGFHTWSLSSGQGVALRDIVEQYLAINNLQGENLNWGGRDYRQNEIMTVNVKQPILPGWEPKYPLQIGLKRYYEVEGQ